MSLVWGAGRALRSEAALVLLSHTSRGLWGPLSTHCPGRFDARPWRGQTHAGSDVGAVGSGGPSSEGLTADPLRRPPPGRHRQASTPRRGKRGPPAFAGRSPRPRRWWQLGADSEPVALGRAPAPRPKGESDPRGPLAQPSPPSLPPSSSTRLLGKGYSWVCPTGAQHGARVTLMSASQSVLVRRRGGLCLRLDKRPGPALCVCVCVWGAPGPTGLLSLRSQSPRGACGEGPRRQRGHGCRVPQEHSLPLSPCCGVVVGPELLSKLASGPTPGWAQLLAPAPKAGRGDHPGHPGGWPPVLALGAPGRAQQGCPE